MQTDAACPASGLPDPRSPTKQAISFCTVLWGLLTLKEAALPADGHGGPPHCVSRVTGSSLMVRTFLPLSPSEESLGSRCGQGPVVLRGSHTAALQRVGTEAPAAQQSLLLPRRDFCVLML